MARILLSLTAILFLSSPLLCADPPAPSAPKEKFHLYILAGQSNMAGRGKPEAQDKTAHPRVFVWTKEGAWKPAVDPLHFDKPGMVGVGPGLAFGKTMADADPNVTIGLIPCAVGGTSLAKWEPGAADPATKTHPYDDALARIKAAQKEGTLKGLIWHQGESDSNARSAPEYGAKLEKVMKRFREETGTPDLAIVVAQIGLFHVEKNPNGQKVNQQILDFPKRMTRTAAVSAEGLTHKGDNTHFDTASARELGKRYAAAMLKLVGAPKP